MKNRIPPTRCILIMLALLIPFPMDCRCQEYTFHEVLDVSCHFSGKMTLVDALYKLLSPKHINNSIRFVHVDNLVPNKDRAFTYESGNAHEFMAKLSSRYHVTFDWSSQEYLAMTIPDIYLHTTVDFVAMPKKHKR